MINKQYWIGVICCVLFSCGSWVEAQQSKKSVEWKDDPVCQTVFFGVLEGLYRDQVSIDVVDQIIGQANDDDSAEAIRSRMKISFVLDCPLCEPTFHAFLAYQSHLKSASDFQIGSGESRLDPAVVKLILGKENQPKLEALAVVVQKWVESKFQSSELLPDEISAWKNRIQERVFEGKGELAKLMQSDENYRNWAIYWGCAACNGVGHAADKLGNGEK